MDHLELLWIEILQDSDSEEAAFVYNDVIAAGESHRLWNSASDETLRRVISSINSKLNDPSTREYGMVALSRFIDQIDISRLVAIHEGLTSTLHLSLKCLEVETTHQFLAKIMGHCRHVPELSQLVTSTVVPKILSAFCHSSRTSSKDELKLIRVCLQRYHGPCGNQRTNLETTLVSMIENTTVVEGQLEQLCLIMPLVSSAGGGGANGLKHSEDWQNMVRKVLASIEDCIVILFGDSCPMINETLLNADSPRLSLTDIKERNVFQRITVVKNRLLKLLVLLGHYLSDAFPSPKPIPLKSILTLVRKLLILDPVSILKSYASPPKEYVYLSVVIPDIRLGAYHLLQNLTLSVGPNIMTEASSLEELTLHELNWMNERPEAFAKLKCGVYAFILCYLEMTRNESHPKTVTAWAKHFIGEIEIKRKSIELNQGQQRKNQLKRKGSSSTRGSGKTQHISTILSTGGSDDILPSNPQLAKLALKVLTLLIPSLDAVTHKLVQLTLGRTAVTVIEADVYPSPYNDVQCRQALYDAILSLVYNPHPMSPLSLSFFSKLLTKTELDDLSLGKGHRLRSLLERLAHPICPTLNFPVVLPPVEDSVETVDSRDEGDEVQMDEMLEHVDSFCQTESENLTPDNSVVIPTVTSTGTQDLSNLDNLIRSAVDSTLHNIFKGSKRLVAGSFLNPVVEVAESDDDDGHFASAVSSPQNLTSVQPPTSSPLATTVSNGTSKRKYNTILEPSKLNGHREDSPSPLTSKRLKSNDIPGDEQSDGDGHLTFESMLQDFVES